MASTLSGAFDFQAFMTKAKLANKVVAGSCKLYLSMYSARPKLTAIMT
jgi:hypothetical protein